MTTSESLFVYEQFMTRRSKKIARLNCLQQMQVQTGSALLLRESIGSPKVNLALRPYDLDFMCKSMRYQDEDRVYMKETSSTKRLPKLTTEAEDVGRHKLTVPEATKRESVFDQVRLAKNYRLKRRQLTELPGVVCKLGSDSKASLDFKVTSKIGDTSCAQPTQVTTTLEEPAKDTEAEAARPESSDPPKRATFAPEKPRVRRNSAKRTLPLIPKISHLAASSDQLTSSQFLDEAFRSYFPYFIVMRKNIDLNPLFDSLGFKVSSDVTVAFGHVHLQMRDSSITDVVLPVTMAVGYFLACCPERYAVLVVKDLLRVYVDAHHRLPQVLTFRELDRVIQGHERVEDAFVAKADHIVHRDNKRKSVFGSRMAKMQVIEPENGSSEDHTRPPEPCQAPPVPALPDPSFADSLTTPPSPTDYSHFHYKLIDCNVSLTPAKVFKCTPSCVAESVFSPDSANKLMNDFQDYELEVATNLDK